MSKITRAIIKAKWNAWKSEHNVVIITLPRWMGIALISLLAYTVDHTNPLTISNVVVGAVAGVLIFLPSKPITISSTTPRITC